MATELERLAAIETHVLWIRGTLEESRLMDRVNRLELQIGQIRALVMAVPILVSIIAAAANVAGLLH